MTTQTPRVVVITRETAYESLLAHHATRGQAEFFLSQRGQQIEPLEAQRHAFEDALQTVMATIPPEWRRNRVRREELDRFLFEPEDLIVAVGQDGLVANVAKYLDGQPVIGVNPDPDQYDGILVPFAARDVGEILQPAMQREMPSESRTMVQAQMDDGQTLLALNELFIGHHSHQSARYRIRDHQTEERHSSSGIIVSTGTGATGWARSIHRERKAKIDLPQPEQARLGYYVREAFPSVATGTDLTAGVIDEGESLFIRSEMNDGGVIFGDGIEADFLGFNWGRQVEVGIAGRRLELVQA